MRATYIHRNSRLCDLIIPARLHVMIKANESLAELFERALNLDQPP